MAGDLPAGEAVLLDAGGEIVDDIGNTRGVGPVRQDTGMVETAAGQLPADDIAGAPLRCGVSRDGFCERVAVAAEEGHLVGNAAVIDAAVRPPQAPIAR